MGETRIQLCGELVARVDGARLEQRLPGRQGRLLFAFLVVRRLVTTSRDELAAALWNADPPELVDSALSALLSKLRRIAPLEGRTGVRMVLPPQAWVDVEVAAEALHRAEAAVARSEWLEAWGPARVAQHVYERPFLAGERAAWVVERRRVLGQGLLRALDLAGLAALRIGGSELDTAERTARRIIELAPLRESGTRLLMEVCEHRGNRADALLAYDELRQRLHDQLGAAPSPDTQALHRTLLV